MIPRREPYPLSLPDGLGRDGASCSPGLSGLSGTLSSRPRRQYLSANVPLTSLTCTFSHEKGRSGSQGLSTIEARNFLFLRRDSGPSDLSLDSRSDLFRPHTARGLFFHLERFLLLTTKEPSLLAGNDLPPCGRSDSVSSPSPGVSVSVELFEMSALRGLEERSLPSEPHPLMRLPCTPEDCLIGRLETVWLRFSPPARSLRATGSSASREHRPLRWWRISPLMYFGPLQRLSTPASRLRPVPG